MNDNTMTFSTAMELFLAQRKAEGYADNSVEIYGTHLRNMMAVIGDIRLADLTALHYDRIQQWESERGLSAATLNGMQTTTRLFTRWAQERGYMRQDQELVGSRRSRPNPPKQRYTLPLSKFPGLLDAAEHHSPRDRALIAIGLYTMVRQSEFINLRIKDVDLERGFIYVTIKKTHDADQIPISTELDRELRAWFTTYQQECGPLEPEWFLLPNTTLIGWNHRTYTPTRGLKAPEVIVQRALRTLGIEPIKQESGCHLLRRSAARALYDELVSSGYDGALRRVQTFLHHSTTAVTERYIGITVDRETRDKDVCGKVLFPSLADANVLPIRGVHGEGSDLAV